MNDDAGRQPSSGDDTDRAGPAPEGAGALPEPFAETAVPGPLRRWSQGARRRWGLPRWGWTVLLFMALIVATVRWCSQRETGPVALTTAPPAPTLAPPTHLPTATRVPPAEPTAVPTPVVEPTRVLEGWMPASTFPAPAARPDGLAYDGATLWVRSSGAIYAIDDEGTRLSEAGRGACAGLWAWDAPQLWVARQGKAYTCDPATGTEVARFPVALEDPKAIAVSDGELWAIDETGSLEAYNLKGKPLAQLQLPLGEGAPVALVWLKGELWVALAGGSVLRFDGRDFATVGTLDLAECGLKGEAAELALLWDGSFLWIADTVEGWILTCAPEW